MNFLFALNGPTSNRGCEAILLSTHELLASSYPTARFVNSSFKDPRARLLKLDRLQHRCHPSPVSLDGVHWQYRKRWKRQVFNFERYLPWSDVVLSLGGDNYSMDYGSARTYLSANERILRTGKRLVIWGASIGPFTADPEIESLAAAQLRRVDKIIVREKRSLAYLASQGVVDNVLVRPDPAFSLRAEPCELPDSMTSALRDGAVGINLSPLLAKYRSDPTAWRDEAAAWIQKIADAVDRPIILVPHVFQPGNDDQSFMSDVHGCVSAPSGKVQLLEARHLTSQHLKYVISQLGCFVGARTHATIAALSSSVPTISIGYSIKARGINEEVYGHDHWVLDHSTLTSETLANHVQRMLRADLETRANLRQVMATYCMTPDSVRNALKLEEVHHSCRV